MGVLVRQKVKGSGVWWIVICHNKKRKYVRVGTKDAAKAAAKEIEAGLATGAVNLDPLQSLPTFREYAEKWFSGHVCTNLKPSSQRGARLILDKALLPEFGDKPLDAITRDDIKTFCYRMLEAGRVRSKKLPDGSETKSLSRGSVVGLVRALSAIFNHAIEDGILSSNPAGRPARYIRPGNGHVGETLNLWTPGDGKRFLDTAKLHHPRHYPIFATALFTGMRQGELIALKWGDIDWHGKFIEVRRASWEGHITTPKSGKGRRVDLADGLATILNDHRRTLAAEALKAGRGFPEWVFPSKYPPPPEPGEEEQAEPKEATPLDAANLRKAFLSTLKKAGLRHIRFHDLRHTFASLLIGAGESLAYVKEQLGHHSIQITVDTYGHLIPGANREAVNRLAAAIQNAPLARLTPETPMAADVIVPTNMSLLQVF